MSISKNIGRQIGKEVKSNHENDLKVYTAEFMQIENEEENIGRSEKLDDTIVKNR